MTADTMNDAKRKRNCWGVLVTTGLLFAASNHAVGDEHFREHVAPVLQRRCLSCHDDQQRKGGFSLQSAEAAMEGGYIESGDAEASHLVSLITPADGKAAMPKNADPLSQEEIDAIRNWIDQGARWP